MKFFIIFINIIKKLILDYYTITLYSYMLLSKNQIKDLLLNTFQQVYNKNCPDQHILFYSRNLNIENVRIEPYECNYTNNHSHVYFEEKYYKCRLYYSGKQINFDTLIDLISISELKYITICLASTNYYMKQDNHIKDSLKCILENCFENIKFETLDLITQIEKLKLENKNLNDHLNNIKDVILKKK